MDVDRHYIGSVTATAHQEKGIITLESNPSIIMMGFPGPSLNVVIDSLLFVVKKVI